MRWEQQEVDAEDGDALPGCRCVACLSVPCRPRTCPASASTRWPLRSALNAVPGARRCRSAGRSTPTAAAPMRASTASPEGPTRAWSSTPARIRPRDRRQGQRRRGAARGRSHARPGPASTSRSAPTPTPTNAPRVATRLMPGIIKALAGSGTPFSILTKGTLLRRDLPLLSERRRRRAARARRLARDLRRRAARGARAGHAGPAGAAGAGTCAARRRPPVRGHAGARPALADRHRRSTSTRLLSSLKEAGATGVTVLALHLRPGAREWFFAWLARERPDLVKRYEALYARGANVPGSYRRSLAATGPADPRAARLRQGTRRRAARHPGGRGRRVPAGQPANTRRRTSAAPSDQLELI